MSKITIIGIGPGSEGDMTLAAIDALRRCRALVGYSYYLPFVKGFLAPDAELYTTGMHQEVDRLEKAFAIAAGGRDVCVISSGDAGIYGMAPLALEMACRSGSAVDVEVIPGISAFQKAAALLGAPVGHDFCVISLSDLLTPWAVIEKLQMPTSSPPSIIPGAMGATGSSTGSGRFSRNAARPTLRWAT